MRLGKFVLTAILISVAAGLAALVGGSGFGRAALLALVVLVVLQVGYVLFLVMKASGVKRDPKD